MSVHSGVLEGASGSRPAPSPRNGSFMGAAASVGSNSRAASIWDGDAEDGISKKHQVVRLRD